MMRLFKRHRRYPVSGDVATYAADFKSATSESLSSASADFKFGDEDFSLAVWVNTTTAVIDGFMGREAGAGHRSYTLRNTTAGGLVRWYVSGDGTAQTNRAWSVGSSDGVWHLFVVYHDSVNNLIGISMDGGAYLTAAHATGAHAAAVAPFVLGQSAAFYYLEGQEASAGVWSKVVSQAETVSLAALGPTALYADLSVLLKTSLVSWWDLEEASGARADSHGTNHLTDNNTVGQAEVVYP